MTANPVGYTSVSHGKATFNSLYSRLALYATILQVYTKPLFSWRKALTMSHDGRTLYEFARHTPQNTEMLHTALVRNEFHFREAIEHHYNFNGKNRTIYIFPWEERIVDLLLYRMLNKRFHTAFSNHSYAYRHRGFGVDSCQHRIHRHLKELQRPLYFIKRDVSDYFPSVDHEVLLTALERWVEPQDYLYELLKERIKFRVLTSDGTKMAEVGIPFGTAIACFFANLYLTPLDHEMATVPGLAYYRYADDILAFSPRREAVQEADDRLTRVLSDLKLKSKLSHHQNFVFAKETGKDDLFQCVAKFRYLGLEFRSDGSVGLSRDKARKIRNLFCYAFRRAGRKLRKLQDPRGRAQLLIDIARNVVEEGFRSVALIDYYLKHVDDEEQLRLLDRWLAEEVLARTLQTGHRKGNFRRIPFGRLREMGLPSLRHRRRLLRHGQLKSSFFMLRTERLIDQERRRLSGLRTFPPRLEAAATNTS